MTNAVNWTAPTSRTTGVSSESINAGANNLGDAIDNETNRDRFASGDIAFSCSTAPGVNSVWEIYFLLSINGTDYEDGDATPTDPARSPDLVIPVRAVTGSQRVAFKNAKLPPFKFKTLIKSELDQNATGVTLQLETHNEEIQ